MREVQIKITVITSLLSNAGETIEQPKIISNTKGIGNWLIYFVISYVVEYLNNL